MLSSAAVAMSVSQLTTAGLSHQPLILIPEDNSAIICHGLPVHLRRMSSSFS
jgi:hypothetical protein